MKGLELIHEHHTMRTLQTTSCASRTVVEQPGFICFPTAPLPRLPAQLSVPPEDLVLILLAKNRHRKGTLKDHSHLYMLLAFPQQNWDASSTTDESICQIRPDQRSTEPNILPQTGASSKCLVSARMVQAYHKASPLPASSKLWLKTSCARDCIFVLNCPR